MTSRDPLSDLLQRWQPTPADSPQFQAEVWMRIHDQQANPSLRTNARFYRWALPLAASLALVAGAGSAVALSRQQHLDRMATVYAQTIDPLQMHSSHTHP